MSANPVGSATVVFNIRNMTATCVNLQSRFFHSLAAMIDNESICVVEPATNRQVFQHQPFKNPDGIWAESNGEERNFAGVKLTGGCKEPVWGNKADGLFVSGVDDDTTDKTTQRSQRRSNGKRPRKD